MAVSRSGSETRLARSMSTVMCILNGGNYGGNSRGAIQIRPLNAGFLEVLWLLVGPPSNQALRIIRSAFFVKPARPGDRSVTVYAPLLSQLAAGCPASSGVHCRALLRARIQRWMSLWYQRRTDLSRLLGWRMRSALTQRVQLQPQLWSDGARDVY